MSKKQLPALPEATTAEDNDLLLKRDDSSGSDQKLSIQTLRAEAFGDAAVEDASVTPTPDTLAKRDSIGRIQAASGGSGNETVVHDDTSTAANANTIAKRDGSGRLVSAAGGSGTDSVVHDDLPVDSEDIYGRTNILGTVSESGGVPTGAIIERGSNANGEFVKFADGTMICTMSDDREIDTNKDTALNGGRFLLEDNLSFPATFISIPTMSAQSSDPAAWVNPRLQTTTAFRYATFTNEGSDRGSTTLRFTAIGHWF